MVKQSVPHLQIVHIPGGIEDPYTQQPWERTSWCMWSHAREELLTPSSSTSLSKAEHQVRFRQPSLRGKVMVIVGAPPWAPFPGECVCRTTLKRSPRPGSAL